MSILGGWTATDIPDLTGRRALVTGTTSGLGLETAQALAAHGAHVVMTARDEKRGEQAVRRVRDDVPDGSGSVELAMLDLADLASVRDLAAAQSGQPLDLLVNNAGVMAVPLRRTADGFELQIGTNHLGHFALTGLLLPALLEQPGARVVTVSSIAHRSGAMNLADLMSERSYDPWKAYAQSKLANLLFVRALDRRLRAAGADLRSVAAHPGLARTELVASGPASGGGVGGLLMKAGMALVAQGSAAGALPQLRAGTDPGVAGGEVYGPRGLQEWRGLPQRVGVAPQAQDDIAAGLLWDESVRLTGVDYAALGDVVSR